MSSEKSRIVTTLDGRVRLIPSSFSSVWKNQSAKIPLDSDQYELWLHLTILIMSGAAQNEAYFLSPRTILHREAYEEVMKCMEPRSDHWLLYCIPNECLNQWSERYVEVGRAAVKFEVPLPSICHHLDQPIDDDVYLYIGVIYCDMVRRGVVIDQRGRLHVRLRDVSWKALLDYGVSSLVEGLRPHEETESEIVIALAHDGYYTDRRPIVNVRWHRLTREDSIHHLYSNEELYTRLMRYVDTLLRRGVDVSLIMRVTGIGVLIGRRVESFSGGTLSILNAIHCELSEVSFYLNRDVHIILGESIDEEAASVSQEVAASLRRSLLRATLAQ